MYAALVLFLLIGFDFFFERLTRRDEITWCEREALGRNVRHVGELVRLGTIPPPNSSTSVNVCVSPPQLMTRNCSPRRAFMVFGAKYHEPTKPCRVNCAMKLSPTQVPGPSLALNVVGSQLSFMFTTTFSVPTAEADGLLDVDARGGSEIPDGPRGSADSGDEGVLLVVHAAMCKSAARLKSRRTHITLSSSMLGWEQYDSHLFESDFIARRALARQPLTNAWSCLRIAKDVGERDRHRTFWPRAPLRIDYARHS